MSIRVLVVDDSVVFRKGISDALSEDPGITVIGTAPNGKIALQKMAFDLPDLVVLDVEMPIMDGITTVTQIRKLWPKLPVIMCSSHTTEGARITIEALERGANDFVTKPVTNSVEASLAHFRHTLLPRIKGTCRYLLSPSSLSIPALDKKSTEMGRAIRTPLIAAHILTTHRIDLVVIGVSTGGPNALAEIIPALPADLPVPVLVVQHMPTMFTQLLAERLASKSAVSVEEASTSGIIIKPGQVWIAPGGHHLTVHRHGTDLLLNVNDDPPDQSCRPSANVLFRSAAAACGVHTLAVVLTGMGEDGLDGCKAIQQVHGHVIVQDRDSSVVWGMPGVVAKAGIAEKILPLPEIAGEIINRLRLERPSYHSSVRTT